MDPTELKWMPYVKTWLTTITEESIKDEHKELIVEFFETYFEEGLVFCSRNCDYPISQVKNCVSCFFGYNKEHRVS